MGDKNIGSMEDEARKRRERLMTMRKKRAAEAESTPGNAKQSKDDDKSELKLRNYTPVNDGLSANELDKPQPVHVEDQLQEQLKSAKPELTIKDEVDLLNLAPRKPDWDLKRDIKGKLDKLEKRTQRAIAELIRERLKQSSDINNLSEVTIMPQPRAEDSD